MTAMDELASLDVQTNRWTRTVNLLELFYGWGLDDIENGDDLRRAVSAPQDDEEVGGHAHFR